VQYSFEGEQAEQREFLRAMGFGYAIALLVIYTLLAVPLGSYFQPVIIMTAIPFGMVGAILGHMIMGLDLTILSMFGVVALAGVVVNDSLVMVDFINRYRTRAGSLFEAIRDAGVQRFRPIMLTTITTVAGLTPMALGWSGYSRVFGPFATAIVSGLMMASLLTLFVVPSAYMALEDLRTWRRRRQAVAPGVPAPNA